MSESPAMAEMMRVVSSSSTSTHHPPVSLLTLPSMSTWCCVGKTHAVWCSTRDIPHRQDGWPPSICNMADPHAPAVYVCCPVIHLLSGLHDLSCLLFFSTTADVQSITAQYQVYVAYLVMLHMAMVLVQDTLGVFRLFNAHTSREM